MTGGRLKILFVIKNLQQGGTEGQVLQMLQTLDSGRFDYRLCTISSEVHYALSRVTQHGSLDLPMSHRRVPRLLAALIDDYRPDVVHSFRDAVNVQVWRALKRARHQPAFLMSVRGRPIYPHHLALARQISRRCHKVTVNSVGVAATLIRFGRVPPQRIEIIHNLADAGRYCPPTDQQRREARVAIGLAASGFTLLCPARISHVKNQLGLIAALASLKRRRRLPDDFRLLLPGRVRDRLAAVMLRGLIRATKLGRHIVLPGPQADLLPYYQAADALVLPSWAEGLPNVSLEGHLSGLPAIVSRQANRDQIVSDGETGLVVRTGAVRALADAIAVIMGLGDGDRRSMGLRGRERVLLRFPREEGLRRMAQLYRDAASGGLSRRVLDPESEGRAALPAAARGH